MKEKTLRCLYITVTCLMIVFILCVGILMFMLLNQYPIAHLVIAGVFTILFLAGIGITVFLSIATL
ncbi:hypothetical protein KB565_03295 [Streptococcus canis]|uniref:hypothetical protein n=1 Tax=Streptococcus canis TaxID=1329 RepID=UPI0029491052|nr:hypothetical protein [Streptococcus canis]MDV6000862.1 hypothetical protein [Streptococcus canis]